MFYCFGRFPGMWIGFACLKVDKLFVKSLCNLFVGMFCFVVLECDGCVLVGLSVVVYVVDGFDCAPEFCVVCSVCECLEMFMPFVSLVVSDMFLDVAVDLLNARITGIGYAHVVSGVNELDGF